VLADHQIARSYLTNTTTRTRQQIASALCAAGMDVRPDEVITAAALTADYVRATTRAPRCFLVNNGQIADDMPWHRHRGLDDLRRRAPTPGTPT